MTRDAPHEHFMHHTSLADATLIALEREVRARLTASEHEHARYLIRGWRARCERSEARQALLGELLERASAALDDAMRGRPYTF